MHFSRPRKIIGGFVALKHGKDVANPLNPHRYQVSVVKNQYTSSHSSGRSSLVDCNYLLQEDPRSTPGTFFRGDLVMKI